MDRKREYYLYLISFFKTFNQLSKEQHVGENNFMSQSRNVDFSFARRDFVDGNFKSTIRYM